MSISFSKGTTLMLVFVLFLPAMTGAQSHSRQLDITGTYVLYREGDLGGRAVATMRISGQHNGRFLIGNARFTGNPALDWKGRGVIKKSSGYYDWVFRDGKRGRTTFWIDKAGRLHGRVRGSGVNWSYVARRKEGHIR